MDDDSNNEFRAGAGADVDGDDLGRSQFRLRDDRIRIYHRPENGNEGSANFNDIPLKTDNRRLNLQAGDLDRNGFILGPVLLFSGNMVDAIVPAGTRSQDFFISVSNIGTPGGVGINASIPFGNSWAVVNPTFATTPASFRIYFDATNLEPGQYNTTVTMRANQGSVQNDNFVVSLRLTVIPPALEPNPPVLDIFRLPLRPVAL